MPLRSITIPFIAAFALIASVTGSATAQGTPTAGDDIPANLSPPVPAVMLFELNASGAQIYACEVDANDSTTYAWTLTGPDAELFNSRGELIGTHFAGPTWQAADGSAVVAAALERADAPEQGAVPWLLLEAKEHSGSGVFSTVSYIQRLDTVGGVAPADGCDETHEGDEVRVPYEATYVFFYPVADTATPAA